ncbi:MULTISPECIES: MarR family winged helix-turn-helix transcriptional regulator [Cytobacillus]|uniref:Transcriptional regulator n=1 Tax=Cytobacillus kochii TaxID=859143 RepID=A0A248TEZ5_9BACI|nr:MULTISPECIES: MarR family transcriptional regulator [Cytobacillus]ASV66690.1 transcriptional regulator [Cytobacillus kochii]MDQ0187665.1 DNA-binding MarR family transcriptional regulator [Cytobacillus kochii]MEA1854158.1 MarR family transcriptional regulator [Cytobacillus sp. OWB-43]MED1607223.1 MarR family transcriptional regulator [Cytobacillus kochii]
MKKHTLGSLLWMRIARFTHQSNLLSNEFLKKYQLTASQFDVLTQVAAYEPITQQELADKLTVSQGGVSRMLSKLEKEGLIIKEVKWKTKKISLTAKGKTKLAAAYEAQLHFQTSFFDESLSQDEQKILYQLLSKLQKNSDQKKKSII